MFDKTNSIRQEKYNLKIDNMFAAFDKFQQPTLNIAKEVFNAYDADSTGFIDRQDLPLVLSDIARMLGQSHIIDKELLFNRIQGFEFRSKNKISKKEFEFLYCARFDM